LYGQAFTSINSAPAILSISFFSLVYVSGITIIDLYPLQLAISDNPIPVLPAVPSTITPGYPGTNFPDSSASLIKYKAALSFTLPPGFINSHLP
jgi:hypothetical protein